MFYSQFILAKKGPLGTIWIAAHLERKLRKNQVADTDIGISVDSILSPDVPIALRLSSHLLLGVVRIYSRKVNYLFNDCSEALLNIKQAFRSTAVDLPPEKSTAPYHSITLPETFHLDDFELLDTAFQGDFVDHHISAKEQITLQDNLERTGYSTSKFGLDERFGDGNASHIGLDFDEDLFLDKDQSSHHASLQLFSDDGALLRGQSSVPPLGIDIDGNQHGSDADRPSASRNSFTGMPSNDIEGFRRNGDPSNWPAYNIQTPDLNEIFLSNKDIGGPSATYGQAATPFPTDEAPSPDMIEWTHAPSTPGLMEETIPSRVRGSPALSLQRRASPSNNDDSIKDDNSIVSTSQLVHPSLAEENGAIPTAEALSLPTAALTEPEALSPVQKGSCPNLAGAGEHFIECDAKIDNEGGICFLSEEKNTGHIQYANETGQPQVTTDGIMLSNNSLEASTWEAPGTDNVPDVVESDSPSKLAKVNLVELRIMEDTRTDSVADKTLPVGDVSMDEYATDLCIRESRASLEPSVGMNLTHVDGSSLEIQGEDPGMVHPVGANVDMHQSSDHLPLDNVHNNTMQNELSVSEFPEPEKMLLAPNIGTNQECELGQVSAEKGVTESDGSVNRMSTLSGKKRRLADSLLLPESGSAGNLSSKQRARRNPAFFVPDDDDLLASILVGKRTLGLTIGPTPPPPKSASLKRPKLIPKTGMQKRKVLLDDSMVLHADVIRQQLINTDDLRRVRKKAPCTRPEIWMIESSPLEDEIFNDSIFSGASAELNGLQHRHLDIVANEHHDSHVPLPIEIQTTCQEGVVAQEHSTLHDPARFVQSNAEQSCAALHLEIIDPNTSAACGLPLPSSEYGILECEAIAGSRQDNASVNDGTFSEWNDDICRPGQQLVNEPNQLPSDLSERNDKPLHITENSSVENMTSTVDENLEITEGEMCLPTDCATERDAKVSSPIMPGESFEPAHAAPMEEMQDVLDDKVEGEGIVFESKENPVSEMTIAEEVSAFPLQATKEDENVVSMVGENSGLQELQENNIQCGMDQDSMGNEVAPKECSDFGSAIEGVDTEFLNFDDEVDYEEENNDIPNPEEIHSLENSGWSSRTRGVARYLKTLFDDESGHGRKNIAIDHLLSGKTRKEASRMFFETLVLKSRDYIHVEQGNPFELINIKPGTKLMKTDF